MGSCSAWLDSKRAGSLPCSISVRALRATCACPCRTTGFSRSYLSNLKIYSVVLGHTSPLPWVPIGRTSENLRHDRTRYEARPSTTAARPSPYLPATRQNNIGQLALLVSVQEHFR